MDSSVNNQKRENLLNLALDTTLEEREKSINLNVGYGYEEKTWEVIVKYNGDLSSLKELGVVIEELIPNYAILTVPQEYMAYVTQYENIEYIEKPKQLFFEEAVVVQRNMNQLVNNASVQHTSSNLSGQGVMVAIIDSGIDYSNRVFRNQDGTTRIIALWDQTINQDVEKGFFSPIGFSLGVEFTQEMINQALKEDNPMKQKELVPSVDFSGHGTGVAGVAVGSGDSQINLGSSVAYKSDILVVKLGRRRNSFPQTTELMRGLTYAVNKARERNQPLVINLSFGNSYGSHDGSSLLERFIDDISEIGKTVICIANGNEGDSSGHVQGELLSGRTIIPLAVSSFETSINIQLWKNYVDQFKVTLVSPSGERYNIDEKIVGSKSVIIESTEVLIYVGEPTPYSTAQEFYLDFIPMRDYINEGIWEIELVVIEVVTGRYYLYLPSSGVRNKDTKFLIPSPELTITIPATSGRAISVGAYNGSVDAYATFSGRGYRYIRGEVGVSVSSESKPDLVAPGVNIRVPNTYGGTEIVSGTSFAVPFVSGAAALLMEWGIVRGNDIYMYGEKVKAYLRKGALPLQGEREYPNEKVGYGKLNIWF